MDTIKIDGRKNNGGKREGSGQKKLEEDEKKIQMNFYVKQKYYQDSKVKIQKIVDKINSKK